MCHLIVTNSLFCPKGKKALTFSLDTNTFMAPGGPSVSVVMGRVRCGIYSRTAVFLLSCVLPIKSGKGWQALHLTGMKTLKTFYILLWQEELNNLYFLCEIDYLTLCILFLSMVIIFLKYFSFF